MSALISLLVLAVSPVSTGLEPLVHDVRVFHSPIRRYRAVVEYERPRTDFAPFSRFELRDEENRRLYTRPGEGMTVINVSDGGVVVGASFDSPGSARAIIKFFDIAGAEQGSAEIGFYGRREFSDDGSIFCVNADRAGLRVFTETGQEMYSLGAADRFAVSADGRQIALVHGEELVLYREGEEQTRMTLPTPYINQLAFSEEGRWLGYVERYGLRVLNTEDFATLFSWRQGPDDPEPLALALSAADGLVLAGLGRDRGRCLVALLDSTGTELWRNEKTLEHWDAFTPQVRFGPDRTFKVETVIDVETFRYGQ